MGKQKKAYLEVFVQPLTNHITQRGNRRQETFFTDPMDEQYLLASARYVELNPVRAKIVKRAEEYPWSSAAARLNGENNILVNVEPI